MKSLSIAGALMSLVSFVPISPAQTAVPAAADDAAFIVQQGATINGRMDGSLQVLADGGKVQIGVRAAVGGDLLVPPEKTPVGVINRPGAPTLPSPSSTTKIDNQGGTGSLQGTLRAAAVFAAPAVLYSGSPSATRNVVVKNQNDTVDFKKLGNLTLDHPKALINLPPGSYGDFMVKQGTLLLGFGGGSQTLRYEFSRLDVAAAGRILVTGPVAVTVGSGASWLGQLGDEANPYWLDLRVAGGAVTLDGMASFNGFLSAPKSLVTIGAPAVFKGGLVADELTVDDGATVSVVKPAWTAAKGEGNGPAFGHRAVRLQSELPDLQRRLAGQSSIATAYPADFPFIMISEKRTADQNLAAVREQSSLFEAFCTLFSDTGFERAGVVLVTPAENPRNAPTSARNVILTATQFEQVTQKLGGKPSVDENLQAVRASPDLLERFTNRALALGLVPVRPQ